MKQFNIGIKAVIKRDDKVLVLHCVDGFWEMPGGRMEEREEITDTLKRELGEEIQNITDIQVREVLAAYKIKHEYKPPLALMLIFYRVDTDLQGDPVLSDEHDDFRWATKDEALELVNEATREAVVRAFGG